MPWKISDVDEHKKGLSTAKKRVWVRIANSELRKCMAKKGAVEKRCAARAIRIANGSV